MSEHRGPRRKAREAALAYLYQIDFRFSSVTEDPAKFVHHFLVDTEVVEFFRTIIEGVRSRQSEIDKRLETVAENWKLYRMEGIDRAILRMSAWELMSCLDTDFQVVIDEAIELAKIFGSENSPAFVNGILDRLAKDRDAGVSKDMAAS